MNEYKSERQAATNKKRLLNKLRYPFIKRYNIGNSYISNFITSVIIIKL